MFCMTSLIICCHDRAEELAPWPQGHCPDKASRPRRNTLLDVPRSSLISSVPKSTKILETIPRELTVRFAVDNHQPRPDRR